MSAVNRKERIQVERQGVKAIHRREVVEDVGRERQAILARVVQILWLGVIALEALLGLRVLLKLAAANPSVLFAELVYRASAWFLIPFRGLTAAPSANGMVLEVPTLIAMVVYVLAGWLITQLIWVVFKPASRRSVRTYEEVR